MSRYIHLAPLAISTSGSVFANVAHFDVARRAQALLDEALAQRGPLFIGVALSPSEIAIGRELLYHASREAVASIFGRRRRSG